MNPIHIEDADDPLVSAYRDVRERDLVGRQGLFVAEGKVVLGALLATPGYELDSVFVLENRLEGLRDVLVQAPASLPLYVASAAVIDGIAGFHIHRGILAIGKRRNPPDPIDLLSQVPKRGLVLVLVGISNHDNIGSIFRNAAAFGVAAVFLDRTCCDPLYRKAIRVSVGGVFRVPYASIENVEGFTSALTQHRFEPLALSPSGATDIRELKAGNRTALFLGTEGEGLPDTILQSMRTVRISITPGFDSLNVAATSAIALHQLSIN
jgi:tRNA G18 (ribose-2'-O)-methylase SpoU